MAPDGNPVPPDGTWLDDHQAARFWEWIREIEVESIPAGHKWSLTTDQLVVWLAIGFEAGWSRRRTGPGRRLPPRHLRLVGRFKEVIRALSAG